jgi:hypothetical protein
MARGGSNPGERRGGRKKGTPNKLTSERALQALMAAQTVKAVREANPNVPPLELAKDVLNRMMKVSEGAAGLFRPANPTGGTQGVENWDRFGQWVDRTIACAKELAKYQSPQLRAILVPAAAPDTNQPEKRKRFSLTIFDGGTPTARADVNDNDRKTG